MGSGLAVGEAEVKEVTKEDGSKDEWLANNVRATVDESKRSVMERRGSHQP